MFVGVNKHVCALHKMSLGFLYPSYKSQWFPKQLRELIFLVSSLDLGLHYVVNTPHSPGRICKLVISFSSVTPPRRASSYWLLCSLPTWLCVNFPLQSWLWKSHLPVSSLFSEREHLHALHVDVFFTCSWGEVSTVSSYSSIFSPPFLYLFQLPNTLHMWDKWLRINY